MRNDLSASVGPAQPALLDWPPQLVISPSASASHLVGMKGERAAHCPPRGVPMADDSALHILVVDDDADTRANLRDILELDDHQVETAGSAAEVLQKKSWEHYAAILLDRRLPDSTAEELLPRLKQLAPD